MKPHQCQASKVLEFLISRSILTPKWMLVHTRATDALKHVALLIHSVGKSAEVRAFVTQMESYGEKIEYRDIDFLLAMLKRGQDGAARRWWIFGAYESPIIRALLEVKETCSKHHLEEAEVCHKLRGTLLELRDLTRDLMERKSSIVEVIDRIKSQKLACDRDRDKLAELQLIYGFGDIEIMTRGEIEGKVSLFCQQRRDVLEKEMQEILCDCLLASFVAGYNDEFKRDLKLDGERNFIILTIEEMLYHARAIGNTAIVGILLNAKTRIEQIESIEITPLVQEVWNLSQRVFSNKAVSRALEAEKKLRESIQEDEKRIPELRKEIRDLADRAQESISRIFQQGIEIVID
jgi:hypothetical protein